ncbi:CapA family protein [Occultella aeris]|uniref:Capsule biosynthesis protein CapA n=1 Tax=Occultella aeris TaxID=2761496 RepID=A0A7M4DP53_9MICO|nr:CapA family protein [Occultella aeris]VZO39239.1 Capsule biosynthesis protein CapA [Occultella aeris]
MSETPTQRRRRRRRRGLPLPAILLILALSLGVGGAVAAWQPWNAGGTPGPTGGPSTGPGEPTSTSEPTATTEPTTPQPQADAVFTIGAAGDVLPHDTVIRNARTDGGYDFTPMLEATRPWSSGVDLALCNMEVPLSLPDETPSGYPLFGAPTEIAGNLADLGWDGCSTGTNHSLDRGYDNLAYTLDTFDEAGLGHAGSARSAEEELAPQFYELEREGQTIRIAQIGATYGTNGLPIPADAPWAVTIIDADALIAQATAAREAGADLVVATLHWGYEYQNSPADDQVAVAEALAASGQVDLIIGNHPHVPQPMALLDGGPDSSGMWVAYSLGNFISNQDGLCCVPQTGTGLFLTATVVKPADGPARVTGLEWTPMTVDRVGAQRVYPLPALLAGDTPSGLTLSSGTLENRQSLVEQVMANSSGADFPERTEPPTPTGDEAAVVPRS